MERLLPGPDLYRGMRIIKLVPEGPNFIFITENNYTLAIKIELVWFILFIMPKGKKESNNFHETWICDCKGTWRSLLREDHFLHA